ncbi:site-specific integrase [Rhodovulum tesquicola]|uniref:tyrosine-type recombinase/integrase n=1 Tax=Rhodovulum tesquicola TaxID=540254 RepID=UPI002096EC41|nr:site-specific integrase [Rhodovulum tesquicola]
MPLHRELPRFAVPTDRDHLIRALKAMGDGRPFFIQTQHGRPRSPKAASSWFSKAATIAGLPDDRNSHGLRKSRMILHAERGATTHQIAAWSGHESLKEVERYTRRVNRRRLLTPQPSALETGDFL